jgi:hypothetical protein
MGWFGGFVLKTDGSEPGNFELLTVGTTPVAFSGSKINPTSGSYAGMSAKAVLVSAEGGDIRFRVDGTGSPSSTSGHVMTSGDVLLISGTQAIVQFRAIRLGTSNVTMQVTYFY